MPIVTAGLLIWLVGVLHGSRPDGRKLFRNPIWTIPSDN